ncbi:MAG: Threonylcarbamoyl-AMP synthase [Candidatus Erwinia impunctatus]
MKNKSIQDSFNVCLQALQRGEVIAYPTEAVFGLGCDPDDESAVMNLLKLKNRSVEKGLILIAADYQQLVSYVDDALLSAEQKSRIFASWPGPVTWVFPARTDTPRWLTGKFSSLAIRVSDHLPVIGLCQAFDKPLVSTSANLTSFPPCRNIDEVRLQLGTTFPALDAATGGRLNPSEIRDALTGQLIRQG